MYNFESKNTISIFVFRFSIFGLSLSFHVNPYKPDIPFYMYVCFLALRPKSTAMVIAGRSVHLTTLFPGQA